jgi:hypothetical protein
MLTLKTETHLWFELVLLGILAKYKPHQTYAERALAFVDQSDNRIVTPLGAKLLFPL